MLLSITIGFNLFFYFCSKNQVTILVDVAIWSDVNK